jgi:single-strand DNA-binding protein
VWGVRLTSSSKISISFLKGEKIMSFNKITIVGYLGRDPELRYTPQGTAVCNFSVATTEKRKNASGEMEEHTIWFRVTAWGRQAEVAHEYLAKGRQVYVEGRLRLEQYTDREGNPRTSAEVNASDIHFLGQRGDATNGAAGRADENSRDDEEAEIVEKAKPASSRSGKKSGSKRASTKEDAGDEELGIVEDGIPF